MTPQERIKTLMATLDNTSLHGIAALDEAVRACSNFSSTQDWLDSFQKDCQDAMDDGCTTEQMVNTVCGIVRDTDTGAITGYDAGSGTIKTAVSIVPEESAVSTAVMPVLGSTTTIDGLEVTWPTQEEFNTAVENGAKQASAEFSLKALNTWWIHEAIKLGTASYGLSFTEPDTIVKKINVNIINNQDSNALAWVSWRYYTATGITADMALNINMKYYNNLDLNDSNGLDTVSKEEYLDRTLAHEFVHALMVSNMNYVSDLPLIFKEGIAELVQGIDDVRISTLYYISSDLSLLKSSLILDSQPATVTARYYAAGYMALRYLAKKGTIAPFVPSQAAWYDNNNTTLVLRAGSAFLGGSEGTQYLPTVTTIDASGSTSKNTLVGNDKANTIISGAGTTAIWGGGSANDTIECGTGKNTIGYGIDDGNDTIKNFKSGTDIVYIYNGNISNVSASGSDVILAVGTNVSDHLTIKDMANRQLTINQMGTIQQAICTRQDRDSTVAWSTNIDSYYSNANYTNTISVSGSSNAIVFFTNTLAQQYHGFSRIDASASSGADTLVGNSTSDVIITGSGSSQVWGGFGGDDIFWLGKGADTVGYGVNDGNDTIENFTSGQDTFYLYSGNLRNITTSGTDVILDVGDSTHTTGSLTIKDSTDRRLAMNIQGTVYQVLCARQDQADTVVWSSDIDSYYAAGLYKNTIAVTGSNNTVVFFTNTLSQKYQGFSCIDASASSGADTLVGSSASDTIITGSGSSQIWGGFGGNDTFKLGSGADCIGFGLTDDNDTILNGKANDSVFFYDINNINDIAFSLQGTTLKGTTANGNALYIQDWSTYGLNTFKTSDNMSYSLSLVNGDIHISQKL